MRTRSNVAILIMECINRIFSLWFNHAGNTLFGYWQISILHTFNHLIFLSFKIN